MSFLSLLHKVLVPDEALLWGFAIHAIGYLYPSLFGRHSRRYLTHFGLHLLLLVRAPIICFLNLCFGLFSCVFFGGNFSLDFILSFFFYLIELLFLLLLCLPLLFNLLLLELLKLLGLRDDLFHCLRAHEIGDDLPPVDGASWKFDDTFCKIIDFFLSPIILFLLFYLRSLSSKLSLLFLFQLLFFLIIS